MYEDFDIEINEENPDAFSTVQLPMNFLSFGEIENDDVKVYIKQDVYKALEKYAREDIEHERGTIILGEYSEEMGKTQVVISNYIEAKYTDASASTLTFTHDTWDYVHKEHEAKYSDKKIVGWQHTHPSYGIFLSNYDLFIHENFFNLPFQVAYVIDPVQNLRGFFQWKNGKIEKLKGYYIYDEIGKSIKIEQAKKTTSGTDTINRKSNHLATVGILLALLLSAASIFAIVKLRNTLQEQLKLQTELEHTIIVQDEELRHLHESLTVEENVGSTESDTFSVSELIEKLESLQITVDNQQAVIDELKATVEGMKDSYSNEESEFIIYTVKNGDTLGKICTDLNIDYWKNRELILQLNKIVDENIILAGQILVFPKNLQIQNVMY